MYELTKSGDVTLDDEGFAEVEESDGDESLVTVGDGEEDKDEDEENELDNSDDEGSDIDEYESKIRSQPLEATGIKSRGKGALQAFQTALSCSRSSQEDLDDDRNDEMYDDRRASLSADDSYDGYSDSSGEWSD